MVQKTLEKLDGEFVEAVNKYNELMRKLDTHRGKELQDDKEIKEVNKLLELIQLQFSRNIFPVIDFIQKRKGQAETLADYYNKFINDLLNAGAISTKEFKKEEAHA